MARRVSVLRSCRTREAANASWDWRERCEPLRDARLLPCAQDSHCSSSRFYRSGSHWKWERSSPEPVVSCPAVSRRRSRWKADPDERVTQRRLVHSRRRGRQREEQWTYGTKWSGDLFPAPERWRRLGRKKVDSVVGLSDARESRGAVGAIGDCFDRSDCPGEDGASRTDGEQARRPPAFRNGAACVFCEHRAAACDCGALWPDRVHDDSAEAGDWRADGTGRDARKYSRPDYKRWTARGRDWRAARGGLGLGGIQDAEGAALRGEHLRSINVHCRTSAAHAGSAGCDSHASVGGNARGSGSDVARGVTVDGSIVAKTNAVTTQNAKGSLPTN